MAKKRTKSTDEIFNDMVRDEFNNNYYGNMDLTYRKGTKMPDGSRATVRSMSFQDGDGKETLIPTVARDGRIMNDNEAIDEYYRTGDNLGKFNNVEDANRAADAIHRNEEARLNDMFYNPAKYRSPELQASIERGRALRANPYQPTYDSPEIANRMQQSQADTLYDFARQNNIAGNGQGFSSRDYLNAVDMFDKYMKGETNDTSWSDFFDKHGLKPISRSNLEKRYRAAWNSDAGKGQGPVPTGEQQAIMQQVAQAQQGGIPQSPAQAAAPQEVASQGGAVVNGGGRDDADWREGGYIYPNEGYSQQNNTTANFVEPPQVANNDDKKQGRKSKNNSSKTSEGKKDVGLSEIAPTGYQDDVSGVGGIYDVSEPYASSDGRMARKIAGAASISLPLVARGALGTASIPLSAAEYGYSNRYRILDNLKNNLQDDNYYNDNNDFY